MIRDRQRRLLLIVAGLGISMVAGSTRALAAPVTIIGYEVIRANTSGFGNWGYFYTGTITPIGGGLANYSGGTGTMANGIIEFPESQIQLFQTSAQAVITVYLNGVYTINTIDIYGGNASNLIPGEIDGMNLTINSTTQQLLGAGFGTNNGAGTPRNDRFTVTGSSLDGLISNQVVFSMFFENGCCGASSVRS